MNISIRKPLSFSEIGRKDNQEDCIYPKTFGTDQRFFILCDGMGGHEHGEVASQTVCEAIGKYLERHYSTHDSITPEDFNIALQYAYDALDAKEMPNEVKKMGTTMTCLCLGKNGYLAAHIGDSRIYHIRPSRVNLAQNMKGILYMTSDHSLVNDLLKVGELTEEEARTFPQKNVITRAMQPNLERRPKADIDCFDDIESGDYFFLCCDGILEQLTNEKLAEILSNPSLDDEGKLAAIKAECDDKTRDNYTCILVPIDRVVGAPVRRPVVAATETTRVIPQPVQPQYQKPTPIYAAPEPIANNNLTAKKLGIVAAFAAVVCLTFGAYMFIGHSKGDGLKEETVTEEPALDTEDYGDDAITDDPEYDEGPAQSKPKEATEKIKNVMEQNEEDPEEKTDEEVKQQQAEAQKQVDNNKAEKQDKNAAQTDDNKAKKTDNAAKTTPKAKPNATKTDNGKDKTVNANNGADPNSANKTEQKTSEKKDNTNKNTETTKQQQGNGEKTQESKTTTTSPATGGKNKLKGAIEDAKSKTDL